MFILLSNFQMLCFVEQEEKMQYLLKKMWANVLFFPFPSVLPKPQVSYKTTSPGVIEANCTSVSRPPAEIVWNVERDNRTVGAPVATYLPQGDGTTLVISTLTLQSGLLKDVSVKCLVHHKGLETPIAVSMNTKSELASLHQQSFRAEACYHFYCQ